MKLGYWGFALLTGILFVSCEDKHSKQQDIQTEKVISSLFLSDNQVNDPIGIVAGDQQIIFCNMQSDTIIEIYNFQGHRVNQFLKRGEGPQEALYVNRLQYDFKNKCLYVPDLDKKAFLKISDLESPSPSIESLLSFQPDTTQGGLARMWWGQMANGQIVAVNGTAKGMFAVYNSQGDIVKFETKYPDKNKTDERLTEWANIMLYQTFGSISPDGRKAVMTAGVADIMTMVKTVPQDTLTFETEIKSFPNDIYIIESGANFVQGAVTEKTKMYCVALTCTNENIYALCCNETVKELSERKYQVNLVRVYDWNRRLCRKLELDKPVKYIAVSPDDKYLFAIHESSETGYSILKYEL